MLDIASTFLVGARIAVGVVTHFAVRIASIVLFCVGATPVVAGPRGGAFFGGGGVHVGGGGSFAAPHITAPHIVAPHLSAPSFAPHVSTPHFSTPLIPPHVVVPHTARSATIPTPVAPQFSARRGHLPQLPFTPGQMGSTPLHGAVRQIPRPTNQAANAFAFSGIHRFGSGQIPRNPFFVNRPVLAHTIFRGRFTQFASRHHQRFLPIIVVGFVGPLFWPYAYDDFLNRSIPTRTTPSGRLRMMTSMTASLVCTDPELPLVTPGRELALLLSVLAGGSGPQAQRSATASVPTRPQV